MDLSYYEASAAYLRAIVPEPPEVAIVLGSALGPFSKTLENPVSVDYKDIPNFLTSTVASHAGKLIFGTVGGKRVVCMSGRFHYYEGYDFEQLAIPVRVLKLLGVRALIVTNAAGGVNLGYRAGDLMLITDHIKLMGASPMRGANDERIGPRFFDVTRMYDPDLLAVARELASDCPLRVHEGVYFYMPGPQFETPAEIRAIRLLGEHVPYPVEAYPEGNGRHLSAESALFCRIITDGLFGIEAGESAAPCLTPHLPSALSSATLRRVFFGGEYRDFTI